MTDCYAARVEWGTLFHKSAKRAAYNNWDVTELGEGGGLKEVTKDKDWVDRTEAEWYNDVTQVSWSRELEKLIRGGNGFVFNALLNFNIV